MRIGFVLPASGDPSDAASTEDPKKNQWVWLKLKKLLEYIKQPHIAKHLPKTYAGFCFVCAKTTFYERKGNKIVALNV